MAVLMDYLLFFLLKSTLLALITVQARSKSYFPCDQDYFYDMTQNRCKKCSVCPKGHLISRECKNFSDTECKTYIFKDFPNFNSHVDVNSNSDFKSSNSEGLNKNEIFSKTQMMENSGMESTQDELAAVDGEDKYWKTLAFALIALLSALIIATFTVLIFVYRKLQRSIVIKQTEEGDLMDDADSGYVVIRAIHHLAAPRGDNPLNNLYPQDLAESHSPLLMSSGLTSVDSGRPADSVSTSHPAPAEGKMGYLPKVYQPQRRLLNYDADDVFESDDNASVSHAVDSKENLKPLIDESKTRIPQCD